MTSDKDVFNDEVREHTDVMSGCQCGHKRGVSDHRGYCFICSGFLGYVRGQMEGKSLSATPAKRRLDCFFVKGTLTETVVSVATSG